MACISAFADRERQPTMEEAVALLGAKRSLWDALSRIMADSYRVEGEFKYYGKSYGWMFWFRRSGKTLLALYPRNEGVTAQIVLGPSQVGSAFDLPLGENVRKKLEEAHPYPEGRWLFVEIESQQDVDDLQQLLLLKAKPVKSKPRPQ